MVTLEDCVYECLNNPDFMREYDRMRGTNLSLRGTPLDLAIDKASGRLESEARQFMADVADIVWSRLPRELTT